MNTLTRTKIAFAVLCCAGAFGCKGEAKGSTEQALTQPSVTMRQAADMLHAVMSADRTMYTQKVVDRLTKIQGVQIVDGTSGDATPLKASEQWKSEHGSLPLPAQMFRMGAEQVGKSNVGFSYVLLSPWPVNKKNRPRTEIEQQGLERVIKNRGAEPFYGQEQLGDKRYFSAVYADVAVATACVDCHNAHKDSPRTDFKVGDIMGGIVIRIPMMAN